MSITENMPPNLYSSIKNIRGIKKSSYLMQKLLKKFLKWYLLTDKAAS